MRKITIPAKTQRPAADGPTPSPESPRPRLGLRYGVNTDPHARP